MGLVACVPDTTSPPTINRSFYYWRSVFDLSDYERTVLARHDIKTLYLRYFDVGWDANNGKAVPLAPLRVKEAGALNVVPAEIIPTVFITNEAMLALPEQEIEPLAQAVLKLIDEVNRIHGVKPVKQIQIDCDWNASSREKYFKLLNALQQIDSTRLYSATLRLHQMKYADKAGVPPVKRCLLMCYNMGDLKKPSTRNSIIDPETVQQYSKGFSAYPLPLDIAFPVFGWTVLFRDGKYAGLLPLFELQHLKTIGELNAPNSIRIKHDTVYNGFRFERGDEIRIELPVLSDILQSADLLKGKMGTDSFSVSLYHLDSLHLYRYNSDDLEKMFNSMQ